MACTSGLDWVVGARSGGRDGASLERGGDELISLWFHVAEQLCTVHDTVENGSLCFLRSVPFSSRSRLHS